MISVIILTKNEENSIIDCLETILWCDEIIVIDDYSTDRTVQIIKNFNSNIKIFRHKLENDFSAQRNYALSKVKGDWILFIDADEKVSVKLKEEILNILQNTNNQYDGFFMHRIDNIWGKELSHGEISNVKLLRLAKKDSGIWRGFVHEVWDIKGKVGQFNKPLLHFPHQTIFEFLTEINYYTDIRATELYGRGVIVNFYQVILYPTAKFILNYFFRLGFLDGLEGFIFAIIMSFHSFLVRAKLWTYLSKK